MEKLLEILILIFFLPVVHKQLKSSFEVFLHTAALRHSEDTEGFEGEGMFGSKQGLYLWQLFPKNGVKHSHL